MNIAILPEHIANQIAAGEVVERPASVIKELVENSIDANANKIIVDVKNSHRYIRVADNGNGMSPEDLNLAFKRHATSKLVEIEDLFSLLTNGFRGEALASISAVSKVTCISKRKEDESASKLQIQNHKESKSITGASNGTTITIEDLFYNTPARLKFLKSDNKERNAVIDLLRSFALAHPHLQFELNIDHKQILKTNGSNNLKTVIAEIFPSLNQKSLDNGLNEIRYHTGDIEIRGYCSSPHINRSDKRGIFTIVNHRVIECPVMRSALNAVYKDLLPAGKYPIAIIQVSMPYDAIDINVHPTKKEVKYKDSNKIYITVGDALSQALAKGFYEHNQTYQASFQDYSLAYETPEQKQFLYGNKQTGLEANQVNHSVDFTTSENENKNNKQEKTHSKINETPAHNSHHHDTSKLTASTPLEYKSTEFSKKFLGRFGAIDISVMEGIKELNTVVSQQGNKTSFEVIANNNGTESLVERTVLLRGDFVGENWLQEKYLAFMQDIAQDILAEEINKAETQAGKLSPQAEKQRSRPNKKPAQKILEKIWERDHYTCVYCAKNLLHPDLVKNALNKAEQAFKTHLNKDNQEVTENILSEHVASFDHYLPASKFPTLNIDEDNLYACCISCNKEKSNSLAHKTWQVKRQDSWIKYNASNPLKITGIEFSSAQESINHHTQK